MEIVQVNTLNEYQAAAMQTAIYPENKKIIYPALGMNGEAGEVADKVKKVYRDANGEYTDEIKHGIMMEVGDVLWYCAVMAKELGFTLEEVAQANVDKLTSRFNRNKIQGNGDER